MTESPTIAPGIFIAYVKGRESSFKLTFSPMLFEPQGNHAGRSLPYLCTVTDKMIKKMVKISTPGKNTVEISDDDKHIKLTDQNKNEIVMNSSGISLSSAKDITLKAKGAITMDATSKFSATAKQDVSLEGLNVNMQAKVSAAVKGNAKAELSASGQTTVKGGMVMIN